MQHSVRPSRRRRLGGSTIEYLLVLALIVIPLFLLVNSVVLHMWWSPTPQNNAQKMIPLYHNRITTVVTWPLG
jgi:hypothetical protein